MLNETLLFARMYGQDHLYLGWTGGPDSYQCALYLDIQVCNIKIPSDNVRPLTVRYINKKS